MKEKMLIKKFNKQIKTHEENINNPAIAVWRKKLLQHTHGKILEVGIGTGSNFPYYPKKDIQITGIDFSSEMLKSARSLASQLNIQASFIQKDVENAKFKPNSFDCIVSTLSLCSYTQPIATLNKFSDWCKDDGQILLLEHGLSSKPLLSLSQRLVDPLFQMISGCHCNRNITKILEESNIEVLHTETYWSDIIYLIWARPFNHQKFQM